MLCKVYFGLHFYLVRLVILREQPCMSFFLSKNHNTAIYTKNRAGNIVHL
jgi:hypothetical protein